MRVPSLSTFATGGADDASAGSAERLREIAELGLVSADPDAVLQEIASEAARHFRLPIACVSVMLDDAQLFLASVGLRGWLAEVGGLPFEWSLCSGVLRARDTVLVDDTRDDPVLRDTPLVACEGIHCYAGTPLVSGRGRVLGTLCVMGRAARAFDPADALILRMLADMAGRRIERRQRR